MSTPRSTSTPAPSRPDWDFSRAGKSDTQRRDGHAQLSSTGAAAAPPRSEQLYYRAVTPHAGETGRSARAASVRSSSAQAQHLYWAPPLADLQSGRPGRDGRGAGGARQVGRVSDSLQTADDSASVHEYQSLTERNRALLLHLRRDGSNSGDVYVANEGDDVAGESEHRFSDAWSGFMTRPISAPPGPRDHGDGRPASARWTGVDSAHAPVAEEYEDDHHDDRFAQLARRVQDAEARAYAAVADAEARATAAEEECAQLRASAATDQSQAADLAASLAELQAWSRDTAAQLLELRSTTAALVAGGGGTVDAKELADAQSRALKAEAEAENAHRVAAHALRDAATSAERATAAKHAEEEARVEAAQAQLQAHAAETALNALRHAVRDALHAGGEAATLRALAALNVHVAD